MSTNNSTKLTNTSIGDKLDEFKTLKTSTWFHSSIKSVSRLINPKSKLMRKKHEKQRSKVSASATELFYIQCFAYLSLSLSLSIVFVSFIYFFLLLFLLVPCSLFLFLFLFLCCCFLSIFFFLLVPKEFDWPVTTVSRPLVN